MAKKGTNKSATPKPKYQLMSNVWVYDREYKSFYKVRVKGVTVEFLNAQHTEWLYYYVFFSDDGTYNGATPIPEYLIDTTKKGIKRKALEYEQKEYSRYVEHINSLL